MTPDPKKILTDDQFNLIIEFKDGEMRRVNIKTFLHGNSEIKTNLALFKKAFIEDGALVSWPNGISIDPETIYLEGDHINKVADTASLKKKCSVSFKLSTEAMV